MQIDLYVTSVWVELFLPIEAEMVYPIENINISNVKKRICVV